MIELRITGETPQEFLQQLVVANAALMFRGAVVNAGQPSAAPSVGNVENEKPTEATTTETPAEEPKSGKRGRPAKTPEPAPEVGAVVPGAKLEEARVEEVPAADVTEVVDTPKDIEGMRALLNKVIAAVNVEAAQKIIGARAAKLSLIPVEEYPGMAREAHKLLEGAKK